jgi:hypothetical protein
MTTQGRIPFAGSLRSGPFRVLLGAELVSTAIYHLATITFCVLVFQQTSSVLLTALTYGLAGTARSVGALLMSAFAVPGWRYLPWISFVTAAAAGIPAWLWSPVPVWLGCVTLLSLTEGARRAIDGTLVEEIFDNDLDQYMAALLLRGRTITASAALGLLGGGIALSNVADPFLLLTLAADGYLVTGILLRLGRPRLRHEVSRRRSRFRGGSRPSNVRGLLTFFTAAGVSALPLAPAAVVVPYGFGLGADAAGIGLLLSAFILGQVAGASLGRFIPGHPLVVLVLSFAAGVPLLLWAVTPGFALSIVLLALSSAAATACSLHIQSRIAAAAPSGDVNNTRERMWLWTVAGEGVAVVAIGVVAQITNPQRAVVTTGAAVLVIALLVPATSFFKRPTNLLTAPAAVTIGTDKQGHETAAHHTPAKNSEPDNVDRVYTTTFPVTIYLADESVAADVEAEVEHLLRDIGAEVVDRQPPVLGSWFRRLRARITRAARTPLGQEALNSVIHGLENGLVGAKDAAVTSTLAQGLGPVLAALQPTKDAVIRVGALLVVTVAWRVAVHQLTAAQQLRLNHQPGLLMLPQEILRALDLSETPSAVNHSPVHNDQGPARDAGPREINEA